MAWGQPPGLVLPRLTASTRACGWGWQLENAEREAMIALYAAAVDAVERLGAGQAVEADFEVIDNLKQIGVKIPPKIKSAAHLLKQTNGKGVENAE